MKHSVRFQRVFILLISIINWRLSSIPIQWNENFFSFLRIHPRVIYNWATVFIVTTQSHFNIFCWMGSKIIKHRLRFMISYFIALHKEMFDIFIDLTKFWYVNKNCPIMFTWFKIFNLKDCFWFFMQNLQRY